MNHWMWLLSLVGILSTAVVCGTDMFFLTIGRPALRLASPSAGTEVMGFFHMFADARMLIWGVSAIPMLGLRCDREFWSSINGMGYRSSVQETLDPFLKCRVYGRYWPRVDSFQGIRHDQKLRRR